MKWNVKKRVTEIAEYMLPYLKDNTSLNDNIAGVSLPKESITRDQDYKLPYYSILIDYKSAKIGNHKKEKTEKIAKGLRLTVNIPAHFGVISTEYKAKILDFIEQNNLYITSEIFCFPLTNYWMVMPGENELSQIVMNVKYKS